MSDSLDIQVADGRFRAYCVLPAKTPAPAVVVIQEIFGVNADVKETCAWLAKNGFIALAPDLFWRAEPGISMSKLDEEEWKRAFALYQSYDRDKGAKDIAATLDAARKLPQCSGKVGVMGFCLGGLMTYLTAARSNPDAAVPYYGGGIDQYAAEAKSIRAPMLMHLAGADEYIPEDAQKRIADAVAGLPDVEVHTYPGCKHAFARHNGAHYDAAAADLANGRTLAFLRKHLS